MPGIIAPPCTAGLPGHARDERDLQADRAVLDRGVHERERPRALVCGLSRSVHLNGSIGEVVSPAAGPEGNLRHRVRFENGAPAVLIRPEHLESSLRDVSLPVAPLLRGRGSGGAVAMMAADMRSDRVRLVRLDVLPPADDSQSPTR
jgi:hypothetical protein